MKFLTLEYIKQHSRIDYDAEDKLLPLYGEAAEETVLNWINRSYENVIETYGKVPEAVIQAALMIVVTSYQYRSPITPGNISVVPYTFDILVKPYMRLSWDDNENENTTQYGCKNL